MRHSGLDLRSQSPVWTVPNVTSHLLCLQLRGFPGHGAFTVKTEKGLGKPGQLVTLTTPSYSPKPHSELYLRCPPNNIDWVHPPISNWGFSTYRMSRISKYGSKVLTNRLPSSEPTLSSLLQLSCKRNRILFFRPAGILPLRKHWPHSCLVQLQKPHLASLLQPLSIVWGTDHFCPSPWNLL